MMTVGADAAVRWLADGLLTGSLQGAAFIAIVWLVCRRLTHAPPTVQAALWWLAALKLLLVFVPVPAIPIPVLPAPALTPVTSTTAFGPLPPMPASAADASDAGGWLTIVVALWIAGVLVQAIRLAAAFRDLRGILGRSTAVRDEDAALVASFAHSLGLGRVPAVRMSDEIVAPMVAGIRRPTVLVPGDACLTSDEMRMALCHELMHVRRRDLAFGWVPAIAERLFFFHPLARLAAREYVTAREAACDAAVVRALGVSPALYGRLLVRLGIAHSEPALAAGGAPVSMSSLRRRLDMLQHLPVTRVSRRLAWSLVAALTLALLPFQLSARTSASQEPPAAVAGVAVPATPAGQATTGGLVSINTVRVPEEAAIPRPGQEDARLLVLDQRQLVGRSAEAQEREARRERVSPDGQWTAVPTEDFLRAQVEALVAQLKALAEGRQAGANDVEQEYRDAVRRYEEAQARYRGALRDGDREIERQYRAALLDAERGLEQERQAAETARDRLTREQASVKLQSESLRAQLEMLREQQQELMREMQRISEQQRALADMQRQMAVETQRLRQELKR